MNYQTIKIRVQEPICYLQLYRPDAQNTINNLLVEELTQALALCDEKISIIILEGLPDIFCLGADFKGMKQEADAGNLRNSTAEHLYDLWLKLATGPYIIISHVKGRVNAGGIGFVAASDIVLANETAQFSLSELLFGLMPACVMPFLMRRIGFQKSHYMTLMTQPVPVQLAADWGLVDAYENDSDTLLRRHLLRLRRLPKKGIIRYKQYMNDVQTTLVQAKPRALEANKDVFSDSQTLQGIYRFVETGQFPWEIDEIKL
jgi:polyketide biosynthesis enoyl-CoA hydratase PksH